VNRDDRNILILGVLILILLAIAYYFLLLSPLRQEYRARYDERTQKEAQRARLEQTIADLENVRRNAPDVEHQILEYSKRLPEQDEIPALVVQIEEIAQKAGVTQLLIERGSPETPPGGSGDFSRIPIRMSFEGNYEEMQDFALRLRNLARLVTINGVTYEDVERRGGTTGGERAGGERARKLLAVEIRAETYVQPAASGATIPSGGGTTPSGGGTTPTGGTTAPPPAGKAGGGKTR
jgi:type IV pilus assembly protein PilO